MPGFATKIENLVSELNEIQISEEGEASRIPIINSNAKIAYNAFINGLSDPQVVSTIDASRVKTFVEALQIAENATSRSKQTSIFSIYKIDALSIPNVKNAEKHMAINVQQKARNATNVKNLIIPAICVCQVLILITTTQTTEITILTTEIETK